MTTDPKRRVRAGQRLAMFLHCRRTMILSAVNDGGTHLEVTAHEAGELDRIIAAFERREDGTLVDEWTIAAYTIGLIEGSKVREGVLQAVTAAVAAIFEGAYLSPKLSIALIVDDEPAPEAA